MLHENRPTCTCRPLAMHACPYGGSFKYNIWANFLEKNVIIIHILLLLWNHDITFISDVRVWLGLYYNTAYVHVAHVVSTMYKI